MFHRSIGSTGKQRISAVACVLVLMLTMAFPAAAAPSRPDPFGTDFGDLPGNYPTLLPNGARHLTEPWVMLGACVDHELDGQPSSTATGDDTTPGVGGVPAIGQAPCTDDEDGITRVAGAGGSGWTNGAVASGNGGAVQVTIYGITGLEACLGAFFDFNRDPVTGNLQTVVLRDSSGNPATQPLTIGTYTFYFDIPSNTFDPSGPTQQPLYARFRIASALGSPGDRCGGSPAFIPTGEAQDGEVEDYQWTFGPNAVTLSGMTASSAATPLALPLGLVTLLGVLVGGIVLARRPN